MNNSVFTLYELSNGDDTESEGIESAVLWGESFPCNMLVIISK